MLPALIMGGASLISGAMTNNANSAATAAANAQNAANVRATNQANLRIAQMNNQASQENAREQMAFQDRMSSTAYQRAMADMGKAGLNPMLAFSQGGASSPGGASGSIQTPTMQAAHAERPNYQDPFGPAASTALSAYEKTAAVKQAVAQLGINEANSKAEIAMKAAQTAATVTSAKRTEIETQILNAKAKREKLEGDFYGSDKGKMFYQLQKINEAAGGSLDTLNSAKDLLMPKFFPKSGPKKLEQKMNPKTGEIETWIP